VKKGKSTERSEIPEKTEPPAENEDTPPDVPAEKPFGLEDLRLEIRKGEFVAIVGRVGSGKVSVCKHNLIETSLFIICYRALYFRHWSVK